MHVTARAQMYHNYFYSVTSKDAGVSKKPERPRSYVHLYNFVYIYIIYNMYTNAQTESIAGLSNTRRYAE